METITRNDLGRMFNREAWIASEALDAHAAKLGIGVNTAPPNVVVRDMGRTAGYYHHGSKIELNEQLVDHPDDALNTIRHELAHWVQYELWCAAGRPRRVGRWSSHGAVWKTWASRLGCTGDRCHSLPLAPTRRLKRFRYALPSGATVDLTTVRHNRLRRGEVSAYRYKPTGESITPEHYVGPGSD